MTINTIEILLVTCFIECALLAIMIAKSCMAYKAQTAHIPDSAFPMFQVTTLERGILAMASLLFDTRPDIVHLCRMVTMMGEAELIYPTDAEKLKIKIQNSLSPNNKLSRTCIVLEDVLKIELPRDRKERQRLRQRWVRLLLTQRHEATNESNPTPG